MIVESIIVTRDAADHPHIAPIGVHLVQEGGSERYLIAPYRPSRTLDNLIARGEATINWTDDVRPYAGALTGHREWPTVPGSVLTGTSRLAQACTVLEVRVQRVEDDPKRPRILCELVHEQIDAPFRGFNRAQAAVLEAAIVVSRMTMLPRERIERDMAHLQSAIDKTAGEREREAWLWLHQRLQRHFRDWLIPPTRRPSAAAVPLSEHQRRDGLDGAASRIASIGRPRPRLLVSVGDSDDLSAALENGAEIIDLKDARQGSLGAVEVEQARRLIERIGIQQWIATRARPRASRIPVSATIGDLPLDAEQIRVACMDRQDLGLDYLKIGLVPGTERDSVITALGSHPWPCGLVAVLFADREPLDGTENLHRLERTIVHLASAGFVGVVFDTFEKGQRLTERLAPELLGRIVSIVHRHDLFCGLAGSLRIGDITAVAALGADIVGMRGGLCEDARRTARLSARRVAEAARMLDAARARGGAALV